MTTGMRLDMPLSRALLAISLITGLLPLATAAHATPPSGYTWHVNDSLSDEFNGGALDATKWRPKHAWYAGRPPSRFTEADVWVKDGMLNIGASELPQNQQTANVWMSTGCMSSLMPIAGPGYYEARIKASPSSLASAFFMQIRSGQEIDIAENYGGSLTTPALGLQARSHTHWFPNGYKPENDTSSITIMRTPNANWHVYGVWIRNPTTAMFYVDDKLVSIHRMKGPFTEPMYMFFDQEPSQYQGIPTPDDLKNRPKFTMQVDWVRSYTLE